MGAVPAARAASQPLQSSPARGSLARIKPARTANGLTPDGRPVPPSALNAVLATPAIAPSAAAHANTVAAAPSRARRGSARWSLPIVIGTARMGFLKLIRPV